MTVSQMTDTDINSLSKDATEEDQEDTHSQDAVREQTGTLLVVDDGKTTDQKVFTSAIAGKETKNAIVLSISFLCVMTSYNAIAGLQASLNDEEGLGVISLSCLFGANLMSCIVAPIIVKVFPIKRIILVAFTAHGIYTVCNVYPSFPTLVPASILVGVVTGPLWTCQGVYLTTCAFSMTQETGIPIFTALSRINGIFWAVTDAANIIGNLVSSLVLYQSHYNTSKINTSEFCGINDCPGAVTADIIADPETLVVYILLGILLGCVVTGAVTSVIFLSPIQIQDRINKVTPAELFLPLFKLIAKTDMKHLIPLTIYFAMSEVICLTEITKSYVSCPIGIQNVGYVLMTYGVSSSISGFVFSRLAQFTTRYVLFSLAGVIHMALLIWLYNWIPTPHDTVLIFVLISLWGLADGLWKTQYSALIGKHFAEDINRVFAAVEGVRSIGYTLGFVYSSLLCMDVKLTISISLLSIGMGLYYYVEIKFIRNSQRGNLEKELDEIPSKSKNTSEL